jgi:exoribonuclease R
MKTFMEYFVKIHDKNYCQWSFISKLTNEEVLLDLSPIKFNMFHNDNFIYDYSQDPIIINSPMRNKIKVAGVLVLENNKSFGRNNKNKPFYKCIPDDKHLPPFLIPYKPTIEFSKVLKNKFVIFIFDKWERQHPQGNLSEIIGDVDNMDSFFEYKIVSNNLNYSLTPFLKRTRELFIHDETEYINTILNNTHFNIQDRRYIDNIFSIDPSNSIDFDDAFSIDIKDNRTYISIYIANVYVWLETFKLWPFLTERVSTIYLPDKKIPMLPPILSDFLCSLQQQHDRFAFALDLVFDSSNNLIEKSFQTVLINVSTNFIYESKSLLSKLYYIALYDFTKTQDRCIIDSHDVVAYWMIQMNTICGQELANRHTGIFRQAVYKHQPQILNNMTQQEKRVIENWNNVSSQYTLYTPNIKHEIMNTDNYVHITSPIRRIVDVVNQTLFYENTSQDFLNKWLYNIDCINRNTKAIRKIQTECDILYRCISNPELLLYNHVGTLFDKTQPSIGNFVYMIYLEKLNLLSRLKTNVEFDNFSKQNIRIFLFIDQDSLKKKIRLQII